MVHGLERECELLTKYLKGELLDESDGEECELLADVGLIHIGTHIEFDDDNESISMRRTAKTTQLGRDIANALKPSLFTQICKTFGGNN